jgi:hypothetical protein
MISLSHKERRHPARRAAPQRPGHVPGWLAAGASGTGVGILYKSAVHHNCEQAYY